MTDRHAKSSTSGISSLRASLAAAVGPAWPPAAVWPPEVPATERDMLAATNAFRAKHGAGPLAITATLQASAGWKARNMAAWDYLDHNDPPNAEAPAPYDAFPGRGPGARVADNGYVGAWAENICYGSGLTGQGAVDMFVSAGSGEGHFDNLVNEQYTVCGMGVALDRGGMPFFCQDFGIGSVTPPPDPTPTPDPTQVVPAKGDHWRLKGKPHAALLLIQARTDAAMTYYLNTRTGKAGHEKTPAFVAEHERSS